MSGGRWDYQQQKLDQLIENLPTMIQFIQDSLNAVDFAICGDTNTQGCKDKLFTLTVSLGDFLYERG